LPWLMLPSRALSLIGLQEWANALRSPIDD
jgi:hypothetical protein